MRKLGTVLLAGLLALGLMTGVATADDELARLEQAVEDAQAEVDRLTELVSDLEEELVDAEQALEDAQDAVDDAAAEVTRIEGELEAKEAELEDAIEELVRLQGLAEELQAGGSGRCANGVAGDGCREAAAAAAAQASVVDDLEGEIDELNEDLADAEQALEDAEGDRDAAKAEVDRIAAELEQAREDLEAAEQVRDEAQAELDAYEPTVEGERHPGCNGIETAQEQVATNGKGKGKAAEVLAAKAEEFSCAA